MRIGAKNLLAVFLGLFLLYPSLDVSARIKCWTNDEGVRECGDAVPPEYSQRSHEELNERGITIDRTERAKSKEELEAERRRQERLAEEERRAQERITRDRVLLATFASEEDLVIARDNRLEAIDARITHTQQLVEKLKQARERVQEQAAKQELSGQPVSDRVRQDLAEIEAQIAQYRNSLESHRAEKERVSAKFARDLERYRALKAHRLGH